MVKNIIRDMKNCNIRTISKMHEITSTIENVSTLTGDNIVIGPDFYLTPECICRISFEIDIINLSVFLRNTSVTEIKIERKLVLFDCDYNKLREEGDEIFTLPKDKDVDMVGIITNRSIYDTLTNDMLIIDLCVSIKEIEKQTMHRFMSAGDSGRKLREDFKTMLENPNNADVTLQVGDKRISAHRSVLCSRSQHFKTLLNIKRSENEQHSMTNSITITDLSLSTLKKLLEFLYTADFSGKANLHELFDLYCAADMYKVMDLRDFCACRIMNNATPDNACKILLFAHSHKDNRLRMEVMNFIKCQSEAVLQTEGWKKLQAREPLVAYAIGFCLKKNDCAS